MKKRFFLVDGHALCYRAYYAFIKNPLTNSKGQNTSAIFGFARMLLKLIAEQQPDYIAVAFDPLKKSFRFDLYPEYKANRKKMPDDLRSQIEEIKQLVQVLDIPVMIQEGFEADDILGSAAESYANDELEVVLVTGDKDAYQLVNENVSIYANKKGITEFQLYDVAGIEEKLGITPGQVIDYMALVGDASDNIPGVKGVGEKTARKLMTQYGTLDSLYEHVDELKGKLKEIIAQEKENAYLSKELVTIKRDIALDLKPEDARLKPFDSEKAAAYFQDLEMSSIISEYFADTELPGTATPKQEKKYQTIKDRASLEKALSTVRKCKLVAVDTETTSVYPVAAELVGVSISLQAHQGWYIPLQQGGLFNDTGVTLQKEEALALLKPVLEDPAIKKIGQNIKYDMIVLHNAGIELKGLHFDTMLASYLLNPNQRRHNMDDMAQDYLQYTTIKYEELVGKGKKAIPITEVPLADLAEYAIEDADITYQLYMYLNDRLAEEGLEKLYREVELPLLPVLAEMELAGVKIDTGYFASLGKDNDARLQEVEEKIYDLAEERFNINSTKELSRILFDRLALKPVKKTKTGFSTDISVLEALRGEHDIIENLIAYRTINKLKTTYIDTLPTLIVPRTGRIHTSYNQTVVATGRLSSSDPNLQNIPARDEFGKRIRQGFVPSEGSLIMSADYSQIELRLAAHLSGDENMKKAFQQGIDIHSMTAGSVFGVAIDRVEPWMRRQAKIINFSTIYGVSPYGLSQQADISVKEAKIFIDKYFETYPEFKAFIEKAKEFAHEHGYVETLLGRRRPVVDINSTVSFRREGAERIAINTPIQGTSADMIKIAMINIAEAIHQQHLQTRMIMQVHDELVFEIPEKEKEIIEVLVKDKMEHALVLDVPIVVDIGWGKNWEEAH